MDLLPKERKIIGPKKGWKDKTWYLVEISYNPTNPVHQAVLYSDLK